MTQEIEGALREWSWLVDVEFNRPIAWTAFGDVVLQDKSGAMTLIDINIGRLEVPESSDPSVKKQFPMHFDPVMYSDYEKAGLVLNEGQCYGYKIQLVIGGSLDPSNAYVATLTEYISFMGDFHRQIKDAPDGTTVTIKVIKKVIQ